MTDPLTGLPNRRAFRSGDRAPAEHRREREASDCVAVLDIDHFKVVNDSFGHDAGDEVLRGFARVARRMVREHDFVARIGGEEFAIFFPDTSVDQAMLMCERLRAEMAQLSTLRRRRRGPGHGQRRGRAARAEGLDHALKNADLALYQAKRNGRDQLAMAA